MQGSCPLQAKCNKHDKQEDYNTPKLFHRRKFKKNLKYTTICKEETIRPYEKSKRMFRNKNYRVEVKGSVNRTKASSTYENLTSKVENRAEEINHNEREVEMKI